MELVWHLERLTVQTSLKCLNESYIERFFLWCASFRVSTVNLFLLDCFLCDNGQCVRESDICNGRDDCGDNSDETNCCTLIFLSYISTAMA